MDTLPDELVDPSVFRTTAYYTESVPVFFGHYWLRGEIEDHGSNVCCLDYSVAKEGFLAGYQFDGEGKVDLDKFVWV